MNSTTATDPAQPQETPFATSIATSGPFDAAREALLAAHASAVRAGDLATARAVNAALEQLLSPIADAPPPREASKVVDLERERRSRAR